MRYFIFLLAFIGSFSTKASEPEPLADLSGFKWEHRVVLFDHLESTDIQRLLVTYRNELSDRDILWFILGEGKVQSNYKGEIATDFSTRMRQQYRIGSHKIILIGKDGGVKSRLEQIDLEAIFTDIDAMPMRRQEMQQQEMQRQ
ncbi:DUF4174 domain-containing protein [Marinomonas sp. A79]|uniref:DUF4174 domain-containing protein n=1 Tax=Marinomonas vulgaris TaxID=2823372 RepID=A0ABS5HB00_9GAMM|nr:DUF4174 domain-containing protein [Marinomonas vulgaris]MBR7888822.1 DUF4174 domain-containing protein [Marinomonas vulgaris]